MNKYEALVTAITELNRHIEQVRGEPSTMTQGMSAQQAEKDRTKLVEQLVKENVVVINEKG